MMTSSIFHPRRFLMQNHRCSLVLCFSHIFAASSLNGRGDLVQPWGNSSRKKTVLKKTNPTFDWLLHIALSPALVFFSKIENWPCCYSQDLTRTVRVEKRHWLAHVTVIHHLSTCFDLELQFLLALLLKVVMVNKSWIWEISDLVLIRRYNDNINQLGT